MHAFSLRLTVGLVALAPAIALAHDASAPAAREILERMTAVYAECDSYMDSGEVETVFIDGTRRRTEVKPFETSFVRPRAFRFEFRARRGEREWDRFVVWKDEEAVKSWWSLKPGGIPDRPLPEALRAAMGVSGGSARLVPSLLMPELGLGSWTAALTDPALAGEEEIDGAPTYRITARDPEQRPITLWIDRQRRVLVRFRTEHELSPQRWMALEGAPAPDAARAGRVTQVESTTTYRSRVDDVVPASRLAFGAAPVEPR